MVVKSNSGMVFCTRSERQPRDGTIEELLGEVFSIFSVSRLYNEEQFRLRESLEMAVRRAGIVARQSPASQDVNTEAEEATALEAVTRPQPVKI
jgi:hypothetical protein